MVWPIIAGQPVLARHVRLRSKPSQCGRIRGIFLSLLIPVGVDKRHYAVLSMLWRLFPSDGPLENRSTWTVNAQIGQVPIHNSTCPVRRLIRSWRFIVSSSYKWNDSSGDLNEAPRVGTQIEGRTSCPSFVWTFRLVHSKQHVSKVNQAR